MLQKVRQSTQDLARIRNWRHQRNVAEIWLSSDSKILDEVALDTIKVRNDLNHILSKFVIPDYLCYISDLSRIFLNYTYPILIEES